MLDVHAQDRKWLSAKNDYITCRQQPCVRVAGSIWSEKNPNGVAVSVRMGTEPLISDSQIKTVLSEDLSYFGVSHVKFFFEQNDVAATGVAYHVRGGTEGLFRVTEMRDAVEAIAARAKNRDPALR